MKSKVLALILLCGAASLGAKVKLPALVGRQHDTPAAD